MNKYMNKTGEEFNVSLLKVIIFIPLLFILFIDIPFEMGGVILPSIFNLISLFPLLYFSRIYKFDLSFYIFFIFFLISSLVLTFNIGDSVSKILSLSQFFISIFYFSLIKNSDLLSKREWVLVLRTLLLVFLTFTFFEVYIEYFKELSDAFRMFVYPDSYLYDNDLRDIQLAGVSRPKIFTSEPSHVIKIFFLLSVCLLVADCRKRVLISLILISLIMYFYYASPMIFLLISFYLFYYFYLNAKSDKTRLILFIFSIVVFLTLFILYYDRVSLGGRFQYLGDVNVISSENIRLFFPFMTSIEVLLAHPFTGVGVGGKEAVLDILSSSLPLNVAIGNNGIASFLIYFGFSSLIFITVLYLYVRTFLCRKNTLVFFIFFMFLAQMIGGIETIKFWFYLSVFAFTLNLSNKNY